MHLRPTNLAVPQLDPRTDGEPMYTKFRQNLTFCGSVISEAHIWSRVDRTKLVWKIQGPSYIICARSPSLFMLDVAPVRYQSASIAKFCTFWPRPCKIRLWMGEISELVFRLIKSPYTLRCISDFRYVAPLRKHSTSEDDKNRGQISD